jgi:hypothetical protein
MAERLGDAPIQPEYIEQMNAVAHVLDSFFNGEAKGKDRKVGFVLLVYEYGVRKEGDRCNFISNGADRKDVAVLFKEMIKRFEGQPEMKGHA